MHYKNVPFGHTDSLLVADIHANAHNLARIMDESGQYRTQNNISLGDVVGYGDEPSKVVDIIDRFFDLKIMGNHDALARRELPIRNFMGAKKTLDHAETIGRIGIQQLGKYQLNAYDNGILLFHATPNSLTDYAVQEDEIKNICETYHSVHTFISGHVHAARAFQYDPKTKTIERIPIPRKNPEINLLPQFQYFISLPSGHEPRFNQKYPGYAILRGHPNRRRIEYKFLD